MMYELSPGYHLFPVYSCPRNSQLLALNSWSELSEVAPNVVPGQDAVLEQLAIFFWPVSELCIRQLQYFHEGTNTSTVQSF